MISEKKTPYIHEKGVTEIINIYNEKKDIASFAFV